jgi:hypothetical protein
LFIYLILLVYNLGLFLVQYPLLKKKSYKQNRYSLCFILCFSAILTPSPVLLFAYPSPKSKPTITDITSKLWGPIRFLALIRVWNNLLFKLI